MGLLVLQLKAATVLLLFFFFFYTASMATKQAFLLLDSTLDEHVPFSFFAPKAAIRQSLQPKPTKAQKSSDGFLLDSHSS